VSPERSSHGRSEIKAKAVCQAVASHMRRAGQKGIIPNLPFNNVSELFGLLIRK
jgi:hypothetical protein